MKMQTQMKRLDELATVERGKFSARPRNDPKYYGGDIPFVQTGDIVTSGGILKSYTQTLNAEGLKVSKIFPKGSILVTIAANIGNSALTTFDTACPDSVVGLRPKAGIDSKWLNYAIQSRREELDAKATKGAQKNINLEVLRPLLIPTPNAEEQKYIGECLFSWDKSIELETALLEQYKLELDGFIENLIGTENMTSLKEICQEIRDGTHASHIDVAQGIPLLSAKDIVDRKIMIPTDARKINSADFDQIHKKFVLSNGDLLLTIVGTIGRVAVVSNYDRSYTFQRSVAYLRFKKDFSSEFYSYVFESRYFQKELKRRATQSAQPGVYLGSLSEILVPSPSKENQERITRFLSTLDQSIRLTREKIRLLKLQKQGLMQKLFGDLQ
ncbi:hypothetical protein AZI87_17090 [Bdellovibrio bacteriovorus]|uniref:Type I restriction modification DNA specificity domain-containing protein n=1 Tax=Bdellovibrio bacteriovorus TaxID=959 RepID=A0A161PQR6_BDEBC|nr:restriction endonuclease subunit S [Bdellovibrio bacteriovorus]KYG62976.1 hypothetical protein AZI87_17090 [Bdellovibrio bacteriovorus]